MLARKGNHLAVEEVWPAPELWEGAFQPSSAAASASWSHSPSAAKAFTASSLEVVTMHSPVKCLWYGPCGLEWPHAARF